MGLTIGVWVWGHYPLAGMCMGIPVRDPKLADNRMPDGWFGSLHVPHWHMRKWVNGLVYMSVEFANPILLFSCFLGYGGQFTFIIG